MDIIKEVEFYTTKYYQDNVSESLSYHSIEHSRLVSEYSSIIAENEGLDERNKEIVIVAAWFHDIG